MKVKRLVALALVAGLIAGSSSAVDAAKRKKKKKAKLVASKVTFFQRNADCGTGDFFLSVTDAEDTDCINAANAAGPAAGYAESAYPARDSLPFILDATKPITGTITMRSGNGVGAGSVGVTLTFIGTTGGKEVPIATWESDTFTVVPQGAQTLEYEADIEDALNKKSFETLTLSVVPTGAAAGFYGTVEHDGPPPSAFILPTLKKKK